MQDQNIFIEIKDAEERGKIWEALASYRKEIQIKLPSPGTDFFLVKAFDFSKDQLRCSLSEKLAKPLNPSTEMVTVQFLVGDEKMITQTELHVSGENFSLKINAQTKLFKIQRRADFRTRVPKTFAASLSVKEYDFELFDLSGGGCRLCVSSQQWNLKKDVGFDALLKLPSRTPIPIECQIRHIRLDPDHPNLAYVGIQFIGISEKQKNQIVSAVMEIYREYFR